MTRIGLGPALCVLMSMAGSASAGEAKLKLSDCKVYWHSPSGTFIAIHGEEHFFGTAQHAVPFLRGEATKEQSDGLVVHYTPATSQNQSGVLVYCSSGFRFYELASAATLSKLPKGDQTEVPICPASGAQCRHVPTPCDWAKPATASANGNVITDSNVVQAGATSRQGAAAPGVVLIEGERVRPEEAMVFTRSVLLEEGPSVASMHEFQENINTVRYNMNTYRLGYAMSAEKVGERYVFRGPVKGWRATSTGDVSSWPPAVYPASRNETMRRTKLLQPILLAEPIDEMNNLRVYELPSLIGHDGRQYIIEPTVIAFFIHPKTGYRMTVIMRSGRTYGQVNAPLAATSHIYVHDVASYPAGPLGLGRARVPSIFYSKSVRFDVEAFPQGETFDRLMSAVMAAREGAALSTEDFRALYQEMARYTGGKIE